MAPPDETSTLAAEVQALRAQLHALGIVPCTTSAADPTPSPFAPTACRMDGALAASTSSASTPWASPTHGLSKEQVQRYSRQLLLPSFGLEAQQAVCRGSVLIVGCGGLGSPAALYLAASGIGKLGLVDHDNVELSNLHRQIIHTEARVGVHKAQSAREACLALNSSIQVGHSFLLHARVGVRKALSARGACLALNSSLQVQVHGDGLTAANALDIVRGYDVVIDCSDNPPTRYLVSDACVVAGRPLVSAAAVGTDGQLTVYHYGADGPCYRCLFPESPAPENCSRCSDAGVLGVVPGIMGSLQALEAIKVLSGRGDVLSKKMLIFDALAGRFMTVKLRARSAACAACGEQPTITASLLPGYSYVAFTGQEARDGPPTPLALLREEERVLPQRAQAILDAARRGTGAPALLLDVRPALQFKLMHLPGAVNVPIEELEGRMGEVLGLYRQAASASAERTPGRERGQRKAAVRDPVGVRRGGEGEGEGEGQALVLVVCRRGNASQLAVQALRRAGIGHAVDVVGGMTAWAAEVDDSLPIL